MANKDLGIRFTEEKYATKNEVSKDLGISLVDNIWANILNYRSNFNRYLNIKSIEGNPLVFCYCPAVSDNVNQLDFKVIRIMSDIARILASRDADSFKRLGYINVLKWLAKEHDLEVSEPYIRSIIDHEIKDISRSNQILANYYSALQYVEKGYVNKIDENFLAEIYSRLLGTEELISFYRTTEDKSRDNRVLIDRIYTAAPVGAIEGMMDALFDFIEQSNLSVVSKALITLYYINYIKPFPSYNDEIAILMMKAVLAHNDIGITATILPLERLLSDFLADNAKNCVEVQKTSDITYFINFGIKAFSTICDDLLDEVARFSVQGMRNDFYKSDTSSEVESAQEIVDEEETTSEVNTPTQQPKEDITREMAISYIPPVLDEKEAYRLEQDLLESDPLLKKGEAYFFARHCTMNKCYTIAQFKKALGCAYETARTSMEHLVQLGYYRREQVKNKFIYTPVSKKGE